MPRMHSSNCGGAARRARGASLIEVLIAVLILAIGLLGVAALQAAALRNSQSAFERTQAVVQTYAMLDAMRANSTAARANNYNKGKTCSAPAVPASGGTLVDTDWNNWMTSLHKNMSASACGQVTCVASVCSITITWDDSRATAVGDTEAGDAARTLTTTTRI
jgi:type IV pilus assembly protein PilV